jgi:quercetin dioxygenase-like cupin family protein
VPDNSLLFRWDALELDRVTEMVSRKVVRTADHLMAQVYLKRGAIVPRHVHDVEQLLYVLQGALRVRVGAGRGVEKIVHEGELLAVAGGEPHQAEALDDTFVLSVHAADVVGAG